MKSFYFGWHSTPLWHIPSQWYVDDGYGNLLEIDESTRDIRLCFLCEDGL